MYQRPDFSKLNLDGEWISGDEVRQQNVMAVVAIANTVKSSLGPVGLDKMLVDDVGDIITTNDGATILKNLDVEHPAAKVLVDLADLQDREVGDGTTSVVVIAAELLKRANELIKQKIHPTSIISGYRLASFEACKYIQKNLAVATSELATEALLPTAKTAMSSKIIGSDPDFFAQMVVDAITSVKTVNSRGKAKYPINSVKILKCHGRSMRESMFIKGFALNCTIGSQAMPKKIDKAKIACLNFDLSKMKMHHGVKLTITDPAEMQKMRQRELDLPKERIQKILASGANVVLTSKGIDDYCMKYFVQAGVMAVRRVTPEDLKKIAKTTGATLCLTMATLEGEDIFETSMLGEAEEISQEWVCDREMVFIKGAKEGVTSSLILRGPNEYALDEMDRSIHDALCVVKRVLESRKIVPGGGAVEAALSIYLETFARTLGSREQLAIAEFAESLLIIPKTLSVNAAKDATELVSKLRAHHYAAQTQEAKKKLSFTGLDLKTGTVRDNVAAGIVEPAMSKIKSIQFATEAAVTILRIDDMIKLNPDPQPQDPHDEM